MLRFNLPLVEKSRHFLKKDRYGLVIRGAFETVRTTNIDSNGEHLTVLREHVI